MSELMAGGRMEGGRRGEGSCKVVKCRSRIDSSVVVLGQILPVDQPITHAVQDR